MEKCGKGGSSSSETNNIIEGGDDSERGMLKKGPWTTEEDAVLAAWVGRHGEGNWGRVQRLSGLARCGKSCRLRWTNHLRPHLKKGPLSPFEERLLLSLHRCLGNKWSRIAAQLPGRTDNELKNFWNTRAKRLKRAGLPLYPPTNLSIDPERFTNNINNLKLLHETCNPNAKSKANSQSIQTKNDTSLEFNRNMNLSAKRPLFSIKDDQNPQIPTPLSKLQAPYMFLLCPPPIQQDEPMLHFYQHQLHCNKESNTVNTNNVACSSQNRKNFIVPSTTSCLLNSEVSIPTKYNGTSQCMEDHLLHKSNIDSNMLDQLINCIPPPHMNNNIYNITNTTATTNNKIAWDESASIQHMEIYASETSLGEVLDPCSTYNSNNLTSIALVPQNELHQDFTQQIGIAQVMVDRRGHTPLLTNSRAPNNTFSYNIIPNTLDNIFFQQLPTYCVTNNNSAIGSTIFGPHDAPFGYDQGHNKNSTMR